MGLSENPVSMMTCSTCRHARQVGPVLCCTHPSEPQRDLGPRAASVVWRNRCGGKEWSKR